LKVIPTFEPFELLVQRPTPQGVYWDDPVKSFRSADVDLSYVGFYDFDQFGYIEVRYWRVVISQCVTHPHLAGRHALIDVTHARVECLAPG
jgi:hypothetical protein